MTKRSVPPAPYPVHGVSCQGGVGVGTTPALVLSKGERYPCPGYAWRKGREYPCPGPAQGGTPVRVLSEEGKGEWSGTPDLTWVPLLPPLSPSPPPPRQDLGQDFGQDQWLRVSLPLTTPIWKGPGTRYQAPMSRSTPPPMDRQTTCENITFGMRAVIIFHFVSHFIQKYQLDRQKSVYSSV